MTQSPADEAADSHVDSFTGPSWDTTPADGNHRIRVSRRGRRRRRRIRRVLWLGVSILTLGFTWLLVTGLLARSQLDEAGAQARQLRIQVAAGDLTGAQTSAAALQMHAHRAHRLTTGPAWASAAVVPIAGTPAQVMRGLTSGLDNLGQHALPQLVAASRHLDPAALRRPDGSVNVSEVEDAAPALDSANRTVDTVNGAITALPSSWLPPINTARADVLRQLGSLRQTTGSAALTGRLLPGMLGAETPQRYFVAFQNEAEARGTGGLPGAFAILEATRGKLSFTRFESDQALNHSSTDVDFGAAYHQLYDGAGTTTMYGNSNLSPHFPYAAQIWVAMWQKATGQRLDGAIAVDPTALSFLLQVTGPAILADGSQVSAGNIVALTQSTVYAKFPGGVAENPARRRYLLELARTVSEKILDVHADTTALIRAVGKAAGQRRVLVWSANSAVQSQLLRTSVSGSVPMTAAPYVGLSIDNDGGNKLDYYLDRDLTWQRTGCGPTRQLSVRITLRNNAPASGLSSYVVGRSDKRSYPVKPGDNRLMVSYIATTGALLESVNVDGRTTTAGIGTQSGHPVYTVDLELPRGTARTIDLRLTEPAGTAAPQVLRQPLVRPLTVHLDDARCG